MKTISKLLLVLAVIVFAGCEGPMGPAGYDGQDGQDGVNILGTAIERTVDFTEDNIYSYRYFFSEDNITLIDGDVVMVYLLYGQDNETDLDIWRALPQTTFLEAGAFQYNFDYTLDDVAIFIDGELDPVFLEPGDLLNQTFRIVVIPADVIAKNKSLDLSNYSEVASAIHVYDIKINKETLTNQ